MIISILLNIALGFTICHIFLVFFPRAPAWVTVMAVMVIGWLAAVYQIWGP